MPCKEEEDHRSTKVPSTGRSMLRISERFTKFAIKREQKKFTFYAEREQIRPLCQIYLMKSEPTNRRSTPKGAKVNETRADQDKTDMKLDIRMQMLVLLAAMIRTNPAIQGSKRLVSFCRTMIVILFSLSLPRKKWIPSIGLKKSLTIDNHSE